MQSPLLVLILALSTTAWAHRENLHNFPHLDPEMTSSEYRALLPTLNAIHKNGENKTPLSRVIAAGTRNLDWLKNLNDHLSEQDQIQFTSAETQPAYPIEAPNKYNPELILTHFDQLVAQLPPVMKAILIDGQPFEAQLSMDRAEYIRQGFELDRAYQSAVRWTVLSPYLNEYAARQSEDVRGYIYLSQLPDRDAQLKNFESLAPQKQARLAEALRGSCKNSGASSASCASELRQALDDHRLSNFYERYLEDARQTYNEFFEIPMEARRNDIQWSASHPSTLVMPFTSPGIDRITSFLSANIQDEWKFADWQLVLQYRSNAQSRIEFEAGALPHVDRVGGNVITMDQNSSLNEYGVKWTIRHEFGHVLGFPDCYHEYYDTQERVMTSYQIDTSDLMCSRRGHLKQRHYDELMRIYMR